jgi:hypothetical protein
MYSVVYNNIVVSYRGRRENAWVVINEFGDALKLMKK